MRQERCLLSVTGETWWMSAESSFGGAAGGVSADPVGDDRKGS
ncbi:hypothetical protein [Streptomyces sp. KL2]